MFTDEVPRSLTPAKVSRLIRRHPGEVFWRRAFLMVAPPGATGHQAAILESLLVLLEHEPAEPEWVADYLPKWKWKDAARVAGALERQSGPAAAAVFLARIAAAVDDRSACLVAARAALDAAPPDEGPQWAATVGLVLVQQDPLLFMKRLRGLAAAMRGVEFVLYRWALRAAPGSPERARVRKLIAALPAHERDSDGEVLLAIADGEVAVRSRDLAALNDSLELLLRSLPGASFSAKRALDFLERVSRARGLRADLAPALKALLPTEVGARAAALLRKRGSGP